MSSDQQGYYNIASNPGQPHPSGAGSTSPGGHTQTVYYPVQGPQRSFFTSLLLSLLGLFAVGVFAMFIFGIMLSAMFQMVGSGVVREQMRLPEKFLSGNERATHKIAVLTISGTILGNEDGFVKKQIEAIKKDENVKAVVLRVVSPGGSVSGSDYYLEHLKKMKREKNDIPVVVSMGSLATSGGYYVSMVGDEIFAEPTSITGSIGVIAPMYNLAELCEKIGVQSDPVVSGPHKAMGDITKPMSEEEKKIWQYLIDDSFARFKSIIRDGRPYFAENPEDLDALATGQVYTAQQALELKLIDEIGFIEDAAEKAISLAGLSANNSKVVKYTKTKGLIDELLLGSSGETNLQNRVFHAIAAPQPYYLMHGAIPDDRE